MTNPEHGVARCRASRLTLLLLGVLVGGCQYAEARGRDFMDIFRVEGHLGPGMQVDIKATELLHFGFGSSQGVRTGFNYGVLETHQILEHHLPASAVVTAVDERSQGLHTTSWGLESTQHKCFVVMPGMLNDSTMAVDALHFFDFEIGVYALFPGARIGFSPGELLDFILGIWTFDLAHDDDFDGRANKRFMRLRDPDLPPSDRTP